MRLQAAAADLKHDAGFLATVGQARVLSSLAPEDVELSKLAGQVAEEVGRLAERLARAVRGGASDRAGPALSCP